MSDETTPTNGGSGNGSGRSVTIWVVFGGLAALLVFVNQSSKYTSLPGDMERQQKQLEKLVEQMDFMRGEIQSDRLMLRSIEGKVSVLLSESRLGNLRRPGE